MSKWKKTPDTSPVWIDPIDKPIGNIFLVRDIPERPTDLEVRTTWDRNTFPDGLPVEPDPALYLRTCLEPDLPPDLVPYLGRYLAWLLPWRAMAVSMDTAIRSFNH